MRRMIMMMALSILTTMMMAQKKEVLNPWWLVYEGALTENVVGEVQLHPVSYEVGGQRVSANVYTLKATPMTAAMQPWL
jgi:hypothetical protein